jgi:hypothetical protein
MRGDNLRDDGIPHLLAPDALPVLGDVESPQAVSEYLG